MTSRAHSQLRPRLYVGRGPLAALLLMAIIVRFACKVCRSPAARATLGQRKAAAHARRRAGVERAHRHGRLTQSTGSGTVAEATQSYAWTMQTETWPEDAMNLVTVRVVFNVQGNDYNVSLSSIYDPATVSLTGSQLP